MAGVSLWMAVLFSGSVRGREWDPSLEKSPRHWPNNRNERYSEPGAWTQPGDRFSRKRALKAIAAPLAASLDPADRSFGDAPAHLHIDGFVPLLLPLPRGGGTETRPVPCELSVVHLGPRKEDDEAIGETVIESYFLLTSRGKMVWMQPINATPAGAFADHHRLARVVTQFDRAPWVLLFTDSGGSTRNYSYHLYRVTDSGLDEVWEDSSGDGQTGSLQQWYSRSNFDFTPLRTGRANEFTIYTTSGIRRVMEPEDLKDAKPKYTKRVCRWSARAGTFLKVGESSFSKPNPWLDAHPPVPIFRRAGGG